MVVACAFPRQTLHIDAEANYVKVPPQVRANPAAAGRSTADKIVVQTLGTEGRKPPPVTFVMSEERTSSLSLPDDLLDEDDEHAD